MLSWQNYKETQHTNNSYLCTTKECFLLLVHRIISDCSRSGNHPHCREIVSSAQASSLDNINFTLKMLSWWRPWHYHRCQGFCHFTETGEVKTMQSDVDRLFKASHCIHFKEFLPLAHFQFPGDVLKCFSVNRRVLVFNSPGISIYHVGLFSRTVLRQLHTMITPWDFQT